MCQNEVLQELGIEVHQSSFEADEVIAHLAHTSRCPVISNDSDFYIFDVDFILLDSLDIANFSSGDTFLRCEKFNRQKMLSHYGLGSIELLHLLAALTGNDYIPPEVFDKVFLNIKLVTKRRDMTERSWSQRVTRPVPSMARRQSNTCNVLPQSEK